MTKPLSHEIAVLLCKILIKIAKFPTNVIDAHLSNIKEFDNYRFSEVCLTQTFI